MIIAIDPGKNKCGLAVLDPAGRVLDKKVQARADIARAILQYTTSYQVSNLVVGQSSSGRQLEKEIARLDLNLHVVFVSEKNSTLEARQRYWQENKPKGLWCLVPASLRVPPVLIDDYAAVILGERYLKN
ncbi:MAG: Holliday junction resolvase RuvX [Candidatus Margulisiibacteriota bacterium]